MRTVLLFGMALLYIAAGVYHFVRPKVYVKIMPPALPWHLELVYLSGFCEIILGILLFFEATRPFAAWGIIILLIAVFPANIQMMLIYRRKKHPWLWAAKLRLPLQLVLIYWAWWYT